MKTHIVCFGDSNTFGYCADPGDCDDDGFLRRFHEGERWPCLLQQSLGADYLVLEEGLCGRTTVFQDPLCPGKSALDYIAPCLSSHAPVSLLIIMLGTNDTKERFSANAFAIGQGMRRLVRCAQYTDCWAGGTPNILIMSPPPIGAGVYHSTVTNEMGAGCVEKSTRLPHQLKAVAVETGCHFISNSDCPFNPIDFMHLTRIGHTYLAQKLTALVPTLIK